MSEESTLAIMICMGSSCFSRGNNRNVEVVQDFLESRAAPTDVQLVGHLCENQCKAGPNVTIDGTMYHEMDPVSLLGLLNRLAGKDKP
jgi:NADH:ubiquinone oxidoreductase subunit E